METAKIRRLLKKLEKETGVLKVEIEPVDSEEESPVDSILKVHAVKGMIGGFETLDSFSDIMKEAGNEGTSLGFHLLEYNLHDLEAELREKLESKTGVLTVRVNDVTKEKDFKKLQILIALDKDEVNLEQFKEFVNQLEIPMDMQGIKLKFSISMYELVVNE